MEDSDWTDLPSTSAIHVDFNIDSSSLENNEIRTDLGTIQENDTTITNIKNAGEEVKSKRKMSNKQQEKESCPICLSAFEDRSFLDQCFHSFCFCCILQWCEVVQTCPLCKAGFASIIHDVKSMQEYEQYIVQMKKENEEPPDNVPLVFYNEQGFNEHGQRFRYRTTRSAGNTGSENRRSVIGRSESTSRLLRSEGWGSEARRRRRSSRQIQPQIRGIEKRRQIYAFNLRATSTLSLEGRKSRSRNISSQFYKTYQGCTHRLIPWLSRDLRVLLGNNEKEINFLMEYILSLITRIDMDSAGFVDELRPFLLQTTEHFVHELLSFAKAPFDLTAYDECVVYPWPEEQDSSASNEGHRLYDSSTRPATESLSRRSWSDTPAGIHEVLNVQDSPTPSRANLQPDVPYQVIEISDSAHSSEKVDEETGIEQAHVALSQVAQVCEASAHARGHSKEDKYQETYSSAILENLSETMNRDAVEESSTSKKHKIKEKHIHRHIHKHVHKHTHKYNHKHSHNKRRHKHGHKRHRFCPQSATGDHASSGERALSNISQSFVDISATLVQSSSGELPEASNAKKARSPTVEDMRREVEELDVQIQDHEELLLSLTSRRVDS